MSTSIFDLCLNIHTVVFHCARPNPGLVNLESSLSALIVLYVRDNRSGGLGRASTYHFNQFLQTEEHSHKLSNPQNANSHADVLKILTVARGVGRAI
jgi:hypothetical protein